MHSISHKLFPFSPLRGISPLRLDLDKNAPIPRHWDRASCVLHLENEVVDLTETIVLVSDLLAALFLGWQIYHDSLPTRFSRHCDIPGAEYIKMREGGIFVLDPPIFESVRAIGVWVP